MADDPFLVECLPVLLGVYHHPQIWRYSSETCWTHTSHHSSQELRPGSGSVVTALVIRTVICFGSFVLASNWLRFISVSYRSLAFRCLIFFSILLEYVRNGKQKFYGSTIHLSLSITPWIHSYRVTLILPNSAPWAPGWVVNLVGNPQKSGNNIAIYIYICILELYVYEYTII